MEGLANERIVHQMQAQLWVINSQDKFYIM